MIIPRLPFRTVILSIALGLLASSCDRGYDGEQAANRPPETFIASGPIENSAENSYRVRFFWNGFDPDGAVSHFEYLITDDEVTGSLLIDEGVVETLEALGYAWSGLAGNDSIFTVTADSIPQSPAADPGDAIYYYDEDDPSGPFRFRAQHTFFLRAVDAQGLVDPTPEHITFTATTIAPEVRITRPTDLGAPGGYQDLPTDIFFAWVGVDSTGDGFVIDPDSTRFALLERGELGLDTQTHGRMLDLPPSIWSRWRGWVEEDSLLRVGGRGALVPDLASSSGAEDQGYYLFLVQAKDEAGAITTHFTDGQNLRKMRVLESIRPRLLIREAVLGVRQSNFNAAFDFTIAEDQPLSLRWSGSADHYGSEVTGYRFGWDIEDLSDDSQWTSWSLLNISSTAQFASGSHSFNIEVRDFSNNRTRITYRFSVVPFTMENELLLIDDYDNTGTTHYGWPLGTGAYSWVEMRYSDGDQQAWWTRILDDYHDWDPVRDFLRVRHGKPPFEIIANYRRLIWDVKEGSERSGLSEVARFVDPYLTLRVPYDYLSAFLDRGGQLLLCGASPVRTMLPDGSEMYSNYQRSSPLAFLRYLRYSQGSQQESDEARRQYLPWRHLGIDAMVMPVNPAPIVDYPHVGPDFRTGQRQVFGMAAVSYLAESDSFPNTTGELPELFAFTDSVEAWMAAAGADAPYIDAEGIEHQGWGLNDAEIYNWDWFRTVFDPSLDYRRSLYMPLLAYVPVDPTCRWGESPAAVHFMTTSEGLPYDEAGYSTGGQARHAVGVVSLVHPGSPSVLVGMPLHYIRQPQAKRLVDHLLVDILGMPR